MKLMRTIIATDREAFSGLPRLVWILAGGALVNRAGTMVLPFLSLYLTHDFGLSVEKAGIVLAVFGLGLGPVGIAFYVWDYGVKHGDIQVLGASSYLAPLLSTFVLIIAGFSQFNWVIAIACVLITGGAMLAAKDLLRSKIKITSE